MLRFRSITVLAALALYIVAIPLAQAATRFAVWSPPGFKYPYLVPVRAEETLEQAVARYQAAVNINPDLRENLLSHPLHLAPGSISDFAAEKEGTRALILANKEEDMQKAQQYVNNTGQPLKTRKVKSYVLPLGAEFGLSTQEAEEYRRDIKKNFDLVQGLGGDDIAPKIYHEKLTYARGDMSMARDQAEVKLVRELIDGPTGPFLFDICRSHQMLGVAAGCTMVQDIPKELDVHIHQDSVHKITIDRAESEHLAKIFPGTEEIWVRSLHHQSLDTEGNDLIRVVARDLHGVVEAIELKNGRGLGVQFHPELMENKTLDPFFDYVARQARRAHRNRINGGCERTFAKIGKRER